MARTLPDFTNSSERLQRFLDGDFRPFRRLPDDGVGAEGGEGSTRPMKLVEIDVIGLEPLQGRVDRLKHIGLGRQGDAFFLVTEPCVGCDADDLGGEDHLVAVFPAGEPGADDPLG